MKNTVQNTAASFEAKAPAAYGPVEAGEKSAEPTLKRTLGVSDAVLMIVSSVIGVGIFLTPGKIAQQVSNPWWFLLLWLIGGLIVLSGAMSSAALGTILPRAGGDYAFLRSAYGKSWAFLYGYLCFFVTFTGSIAVYATGVMHYQGTTIFGSVVQSVFVDLVPGYWTHSLVFGGETYFYMWMFPIRVEQAVALLIIGLFTFVNHFGIRRSLNLQKIITLTPLAFLVVAGVVIVYRVMTGEAAAAAVLSNSFAEQSVGDMPSIGVMAMSMMFIFFTYSGWNAALYLGEDIKTPKKVIPRALMIGLAVIAGVYLLFCLVILSTIPYETLHGQDLDIASVAWGALFGKSSRTVMAILIAVMILGGLNSSIISGSRIFFAMARDRIFFSKAMHIHPRYHTPTWALWAQCLWACCLILFVGEFETILEYTTLVMIFMSIVTIFSIFRLTRRMHDESQKTKEREERERLLGYPYMPVVYIISTILVLIGYLSYSRENAEQGLIGLGIIVSGFLIYYVWSHGNRIVTNRRNGRLNVEDQAAANRERAAGK